MIEDMVTQEKQAQTLLRDLISRISEDELCAGWMQDIEIELWNRIMNKADTTKTTTRLRELSESAGGWWYWPVECADPEFVTREAWLSIISATKKND